MFELFFFFAQKKGAPTSFLGSPIIFMVLVFVLFYFMLIRPEKKRQKQHQDLLNRLKKGDKIFTNSGIFGEIDSITATEATVEIAPKVKIRIQRQAIAGIEGQTEVAAETAEKKA